MLSKFLFDASLLFSWRVLAVLHKLVPSYGASSHFSMEFCHRVKHPLVLAPQTQNSALVQGVFKFWLGVVLSCGAPFKSSLKIVLSSEVSSLLCLQNSTKLNLVFQF